MKTYLRYETTPGTGVICSNRSDGLVVRHGKVTLAITPAFESVLVWDIIRGEMRARFDSRKQMDGEVSCLAIFVPGKQGEPSNSSTLVVGRTKGRVDLHTFQAISFMTGAANPIKNRYAPRVSLAGHSSAVTCAAFNKDGSRLATGSMDTFVIVWDPMTETGLFRLKGHKDEVTCVRFCDWLGGEDVQLISSSKDTTMKLWDLESQHCEKTLADHPNAVWCIDTTDFAQRKRVYTGSSDGLIRSFDPADWSRIMPGSMNRQTSQRAETLVCCNDVLAIQSAGKVIEFYRLRTAEGALKKQKRRLKRLREKEKEISDEDERNWTQDELELACVLRTSNRARSISLIPASDGAKGDVLCMITFTNNLVELYTLKTEEEADEEEEEVGGERGANEQRKRAKSSGTKLKSTLALVSRLELQGHRTDIRCVSLGEDDEMAITAADGAIKLWNVSSGACLRTMPSGFSLCCAFSPISLHSIVGTQEGQLLIHSLNDGAIAKEIDKAHDGQPVYSLDLSPDGAQLVTCGGDRQCKFWSFKVASNKQVTLAHTRTLRLGEDGDAQCVRFARGAKKADQLKVCVAMLDSTVKVFHEDSLGFHLSLYGHKLPVLSMDASDDGLLLATGSADKSVKIWGLDFGDCHKSVFAHDGSVTCVRFVPNTHYLVTCGRDGRVRHWDCDSNMERILSFDYAHYGDAYGLAVSTDGGFFLSVGKDKRIRKYERTRDIVFIEEEREKELEDAAEEEREGVDESKDQITAIANLPGGIDSESLAVTKKTMQAVDVGDRLIAALTNTLEQQPQQDDEEEEDFLTRVGVTVAKTARESPPQDLADALVFLPSVHVRPMLIAFAFALKARVEIEVVTKAALTLIKIHGSRLTSPKDRDAVELLRKHMREALWEVRDVIGKNAAGIRWLQRTVEENVAEPIPSLANIETVETRAALGDLYS